MRKKNIRMKLLNALYLKTYFKILFITSLSANEQYSVNIEAIKLLLNTLQVASFISNSFSYRGRFKYIELYNNSVKFSST